MRKDYYKLETRMTYREIRKIVPELKKIEAARRHLREMIGKVISKII